MMADNVDIIPKLITTSAVKYCPTPFTIPWYWIIRCQTPSAFRYLQINKTPQ